LIFLSLTLIVVGFILYCAYFLPTYPKNTKIAKIERITLGNDFYKADNSWLLKNKYGLWEMYVEGNGIERGNKIGVLSKELIIKQEDAFVEQIKMMLPSKFIINFLRVGISVYNRKLGKYIPEENKEEIYAISRYASPNYGWIGNNYQRIMNYHAAHDIGHAAQLMGFAGCSSLAVWGEKTDDGNLLIGRNFDFYVGDKFAQDKILLFVNPTDGYKHAFVTWGGMIGVVSGMNEKGLCVLINAASSEIPFSSATPVSILAREILQYAKNIDEAISIAQQRKTFVSEQFIIASAEDNKAISIEKTKNEQVTYSVSTPYLVCTNHFQSDKLSQKEESTQVASGYRMDRMYELLDSTQKFSPQQMVDFLRDKKGLKGENIGLGNEKSINQLIAHHSVVFHPQSRTLWISTTPYQEGAFLAYNLDNVFNEAQNLRTKGFSIEEQLIPANYPFIQSNLDAYDFYRRSINTPIKSFNRDINIFLDSNPENYRTYEYLGDYYSYKNDAGKAKLYYELSLRREIASEHEHRAIIIKLINVKKIIKKESEQQLKH
jgi:predicted choloylglycine hydrolase